MLTIARRPCIGTEPALLCLFMGLAAATCLPGGRARADEAKALAIHAGRIETLAGEAIEDGVVLVVKGRIEAVGAELEVPEGAEVLDARDAVVYPGLVNAVSRLGLSAASGGKAASNPHHRVADELYPFQDAYKRAARAGFTTLALVPGRPGIAGQAALVRTVAGSAEEMLLSDRGPLVVAFRADTETRNTIKGALDAANRSPSTEGKTAPLAWAVQGEIPTVVTCAGAGEAAHVLKLLEPYKKMHLVLSSPGGDIHRITDRLGERKASIVVPARISFERYTRTRINIPRMLTEAGAKVACRPASDSVAGCEAFRQAMAELVRAGLDREMALKAMTIHPAEMLGLDYRLGSLEQGKDANLIILDGDIFDARAEVLRVLIEGETVYDAAWGGLR